MYKEMLRALFLVAIAALLSITATCAIIAWQEGHFSSPITTMSYAPCGSFDSITFRSDGRIEMVSKSFHEVYEYEIVDAGSAVVRTPIATFLVPFDRSGTITWPNLMSQKGYTCQPSVLRETPATDVVLGFIDQWTSKPVDAKLKVSWELMYQAAYGEWPIYSRGITTYDSNVRYSYDSADFYSWTGKKAAGVPSGMSLYADLEDLQERTAEIARAACIWLKGSDHNRLQIGASGNGWSGGQTGGMTITSETCQSGPIWQIVGADQ